MAENTNTNTNTNTFSCTQENKELVITGTFRIPMTYAIEGKRNNQKQTAKGTLQSIDTASIEYMLAYDIKRRMQNAILPKGLGDTVFIAEGEELRKANGTQTATEAAVRTERFRVIEALVASGMTREQALELVGCTEEDLPQ